MGDAVPAKDSSDHNEKKGGCDGVLHKNSVAPAGDSVFEVAALSTRIHRGSGLGDFVPPFVGHNLGTF